MTTIRQDILKPVEWVKYLAAALAVSLFIAVVYPFIHDVLEETYTPRDYWFTYHSVEPTKPTYRIGEDITFYSDREVRRTAYFHWSDTLRCDTNGVGGVGDRTYSIYESGKMLRPHAFQPPGDIWTYRAETPDVPATCYLISTTTAKLRYANKVQTLISAPFEIR